MKRNGNWKKLPGWSRKMQRLITNWDGCTSRRKRWIARKPNLIAQAKFRAARQIQSLDRQSPEERLPAPTGERTEHERRFRSTGAAHCAVASAAHRKVATEEAASL